MADNYKGRPAVTTPTGKKIKYQKRPKRYVGAAVKDIRNYLASPLGFFGRERKKQERLMRTGQLLGMMPQEASRSIYQKIFPFRLSKASADIALPNGKEITINKMEKSG